ncbi:hypothetical protein ANOM_011007 [Aspergillus nomiae NRRL 13137]|uniref:Alpha/beta hydrolase fold-3 domain-containing protein n=1 Tax=Aspergillus nomiae NRRL (strain ATCC 15546 / NRRL 13137 / CBS 260.88 / M93) TaxID=1509407 RepID=A0A0L1IN27_ASPN3|nr:uncharacterized protein ANOM_011007 [Aspergillus nomiae NRRL 13137]KNG80715.1 hypothetical protein ANOM_011007 [Aspergillus nomiae NRRL 13137]
MLAAYRWVLQCGALPEQVVFAGDSAGGNLAMLTLLYIRDHGKTCGLSLPNCAVLISPWLDMTGARTIGSPNVRHDIVLEYDTAVPILLDALKPSDLPPDTPEISSLLTHDVSGYRHNC